MHKCRHPENGAAQVPREKKDRDGEMKYYSKFLDIVQLVCKWLVIAMMAGFVTIVIVAVFFRYVLVDPITWSEQAARFLFVWTIMLGIPMYYRSKLATNFDLITEKFPPAIKDVTGIVMDIMVGFFACYYGYAGLKYTVKAGKTIFQGLDIPTGAIYISEVVCGSLLLLCVIEAVCGKLSKFFGSGKRKEGKRV